MTRWYGMLIDVSPVSCMTTCPSGVNYMHLVDHARAHIEETYSRPLLDRALRSLLAWLLPYPNRFRFALLGAAMARPFAGLFGEALGGRVKAMLSLRRGSFPHAAARKTWCPQSGGSA